MKPIHPIISRFLGAALLLVSTLSAPFFASPPQQTEAQQTITISATVPSALDLTISTPTVSFGSINPGQLLDKPGAFSLTVRTNTPTWNVTAWTETANLASGSSTIPVQDNLYYSFNADTWYPLSSVTTSLFGNVEYPTPPSSLPISMRLKVPTNTSPGDYSVNLLVHIQ